MADLRGRASRELLDRALAGLAAVGHRGAWAADGVTGDGAGVLLPLSPTITGTDGRGRRDVLPPGGVAPLGCRGRVPRGRARARRAGARFRSGRPHSASPRSRRSRGSTSSCSRRRSSTDAERRAYRARRRAERVPGVYVASLSFRTVTYKALCAAAQLARFYPDLEDPDLAVPFAIFHQRFSTNTEPSWERAQPFRLLCHNGEINTIDGNVTWTEARERARGDEPALAPALDPSGSDSALLDNALELLVRDDGVEIAPGAVDARPARLAERPAPGRRGSRLPPLRRDAQRAVGRTGGAVLHGRTDVRRGARPQRPSTTSRRRSPATSFSPSPPRQGRCRCRTASPCAGRGWDRAAS